MCFETAVEFYFTNLTVNSLAKSLATMKKTHNSKLKIFLKFGKTLDGVSFENLKNLLKLADRTAYINLEGTSLEQIMKNEKIMELSKKNAS